MIRTIMREKKQNNKSFSWKKQIFNIIREPSYITSLMGHEHTKIFIFFEQYVPKFIFLFKKIRYLFYLGQERFCPCCGGHFRKFLPIGAKYRSSAQCPKCRSLERHRLVLLYLKYKTNFFTKNLKVLYVAPKEILQTKFKKMSNLDFVSIDLDSPLAMIKMDIMNLQFEDNFFNVILCSHVLEHVKEDLVAMKELFRVLKPNGWAIIQAPIDYHRKKTFEDPNVILPRDRRCLFGEENHFRIYGQDYKNRLESAGFKVKADDFVREIDKKLINKYSLDEQEKIYYCEKKNSSFEKRLHSH